MVWWNWKCHVVSLFQRKHPRHANVADDKNYLDSLLKDANELDESQINRMNSELHNPTQDQPLIISMDSLTADQIVELDEQIVGQGIVYNYQQSNNTNYDTDFVCYKHVLWTMK